MAKMALHMLFGVVLSKAVMCLQFRDDTSKDVSKDGTENLCINGRLAPELIVIGAARASTSLFARNLLMSPGIIYATCIEGDNLPYACPAIGIKEMHFFSNEDKVKKGSGFYLDHYPQCQKATRQVAADITPGYHTNAQVPQRIIDLYGAEVHRVKFVLLMRDPIMCMQSFFYYEHQDKKQTFSAYVEKVLKLGNGRYLNNALFAPVIERYLSAFSPSQLTIVPYSYNTEAKDNFPKFTEFVWSEMGVPSAPDDKAPIEKWNTWEHPPLEEDLDAATTGKLQQLIDTLTGPKLIASILAPRHAGGVDETRGPHLYGYTGAAGDATAIEAWVKGGW